MRWRSQPSTCRAVPGCTSSRHRRWWRSTLTPGRTTASRQGKAAAQLAMNRGCTGAGGADPVAEPVGRRSWSISPVCPLAGARPRPALAGGAGGGSAASPPARLHRAGAGRNCPAADASSAARITRRAACRRPGCVACGRGAGGGATTPPAGVARVTGDRGGAAGRHRGDAGSCATGRPCVDTAVRPNLPERVGERNE